MRNVSLFVRRTTIAHELWRDLNAGCGCDVAQNCALRPKKRKSRSKRKIRKRIKSKIKRKSRNAARQQLREIRAELPQRRFDDHDLREPASYSYSSSCS